MSFHKSPGMARTQMRGGGAGWRNARPGQPRGVRNGLDGPAMAWAAGTEAPIPEGTSAAAVIRAAVLRHRAIARFCRKRAPDCAKKNPPIRITGEWGDYSLLGLFIGPYLAFRRIPLAWGTFKGGVIPDSANSENMVAGLSIKTVPKAQWREQCFALERESRVCCMSNGAKIGESPGFLEHGTHLFL